MHWFEAFLLIPISTQKSLPSSLKFSQVIRQKEITHTLPPSTPHHPTHPGSNFLKIYFLQQQKRVEGTMICFIRILSENMNMTWDIRFFMFCMFYNFLKCDVFTVLWIVLSHSVVLNLLLLLWSYDNLTLKLHQKKTATLMKGRFL